MDRYPKFFEKTFLIEGYFQDNSRDKGNYYKGKLYGTICGITARDHFRDFTIALQLFDMKKFGLLKDYCMKFYAKKGYWNPLYNEIDDSSLAFKIWDFGVNAHPKTAVKILQRVLVRYYGFNIEDDGVFGPVTLKCVNEAFYEAPANIEPKVKRVEGESIIYAYYVHKVETYYRSLDRFIDFGTGWLRRLVEVFNGVPDKIRGMVARAKGYEKPKRNF